MAEDDKQQPLSLRPVKFDEAIKAAEKRGVVLPDVYYGQLQGIERALAFSIAGIASIDQLQQTLDSLADAMEQGASFEQWRSEIMKRKDAKDVLSLPAHRLDNIFRTNIQGAYARGRCVHIERHKDTRPYLMYSAVNDGRTRPSHAAMHGHVAPVDDPIWKRWTPPAGYRCRCTVISMSEEQANKYMEQDQKRLERDPDAAQARAAARLMGPDEGWGYSPCEQIDRGIDQAADSRRDKYHPALRRMLEKISEEFADMMRKANGGQ